MDIADSLTGEEKIKLRNVVEKELEQYRLFKSCIKLEEKGPFFSRRTIEKESGVVLSNRKCGGRIAVLREAFNY